MEGVQEVVKSRDGWGSVGSGVKGWWGSRVVGVHRVVRIQAVLGVHRVVRSWGSRQTSCQP